MSAGHEFGDVVLVPFPFTDQSASKRRPAVVVSSEAYHNERPDLVILAITSQVRPGARIGEVAIAQWKEAGLLKASVLKPVVATIERGLVLRKLGRLEEEDRRALRGVLDVILGK
ncbi:MAG: type II toxin-antitoxin system PemK/MazF family toxin [bacterium]|nr:type II toxin-antitoxin system PemK/MazF family toxin [bacterium]